MTFPEFSNEFARLEKHFRIPDDDRMVILKDWFKALSHYHVDAVSSAIDQVIEQSTDTFWPALGKVTGAIKAKLSRYEHTRRECATCNGSTWIEARPWKSNGRIYTGYVRCPDCGVPAPKFQEPKFRDELTATEYAQWLRGEFKEPAIQVSKSNHMVAEALRHINPAVKSMPKISVTDLAPEQPDESEEPDESIDGS